MWLALSSCGRPPPSPAAPAATPPGRARRGGPSAPPAGPAAESSHAPATTSPPPSLRSLHVASDRAVSGRGGVVVTSEANATRAGIAALEKGGNAADAIAAAAFALAVTHPSAGNLGGGGIILYRPHGGPTVAIEFREKAPASVTQAAFDRMIAARAIGPA